MVSVSYPRARTESISVIFNFSCPVVLRSTDSNHFTPTVVFVQHIKKDGFHLRYLFFLRVNHVFIAAYFYGAGMHLIYQ
jgi:hypothetical protein